MNANSPAFRLKDYCTLAAAARIVGESVEHVVRVAEWHGLKVNMPCIAERLDYEGGKLVSSDLIMTWVPKGVLFDLAFGEGGERTCDLGESERDGRWVRLRFKRKHLQDAEISRSALESAISDHDAKRGLAMSAHGKNGRGKREPSDKQKIADELAKSAQKDAAQNNACGTARSLLNSPVGKAAKAAGITHDYLAKRLRLLHS